ncbi:Uma2 family endonuclease [Nocardia inohanensis]|uniref:Uma2 family endonuclease n=1 Tax=Nocardia inohanensis TaxID=209246 RepID=UPI000831A611|nr:Uma2 family endonuclease [Nocardia inohanensis]
MRRSSSAEALKSIASWPDHLLTLAEWSQLPTDNRICRELVDGVLVVAPQPPRHQLAVWRLAAQLEPALPRRVAALARVELVIDEGTPPTVRTPDLLVVGGTAGATHPSRVWPSDVLAAIEIVAPSSRRTDRIMKLVEYAAVGIQRYWLIDPDDPVRITTHELCEDFYEVTGVQSGHARLELAGMELDLDLDALTALRIPD